MSSIPATKEHIDEVGNPRTAESRPHCMSVAYQAFVDAEALFLYAPANQVLTVAEREGAAAYDVPDVELGHHGDECSFDAIIHKYELAKSNPALARLALIVRGADTQQRDLTPESRGLLAIAQGFSEAYADDHEQLAAEMPVYDALYAWCRTQSNTA